MNGNDTGERDGLAILRAFALAMLISTVGIGAASATQFYVNETGWWRVDGAFNASGTPIQAAVNAADNGDSIYVYNGSYTENVGVSKRLMLQGEGADVVIVTAANIGDHVFEVTANWVTISGFTMTGAINVYDGKAGIYLRSSDHCSIYDNNASNNVYGIYLRSSSNNTLENNVVNSNSDDGINLYTYPYSLTSTNNTFTNNTTNSNGDDGISIDQSTNNRFTDNIVNSNDGDGICLCSYSNDNKLFTPYQPHHHDVLLPPSGLIEQLEKRASNLIDTGKTDMDVGEGFGIRYAVEFIKTYPEGLTPRSRPVRWNSSELFDDYILYNK